MVSSNHSHMAQYFATWSEVVLPLYLARRRSGGLWGWWGSMGAYQTKNGLLEALASSRKVVMGAKVCGQSPGQHHHGDRHGLDRHGSWSE